MHSNTSQVSCRHVNNSCIEQGKEKFRKRSMAYFKMINGWNLFSCCCYKYIINIIICIAITKVQHNALHKFIQITSVGVQ